MAGIWQVGPRAARGQTRRLPRPERPAPGKSSPLASLRRVVGPAGAGSPGRGRGVGGRAGWGLWGVSEPRGPGREDRAGGRRAVLSWTCRGRVCGRGRARGGGRAQPGTSAAGSGGQRRPVGPQGTKSRPPPVPWDLSRAARHPWAGAPQRLCGPGPAYGAGAEPAAGTAPRAPRWAPRGLRGWSSRRPCRGPRDSRASGRGARASPLSRNEQHAAQLSWGLGPGRPAAAVGPRSVRSAGNPASGCAVRARIRAGTARLGSRGARLAVVRGANGSGWIRCLSRPPVFLFDARLCVAVNPVLNQNVWNLRTISLTREPCSAAQQLQGARAARGRCVSTPHHTHASRDSPRALRVSQAGVRVSAAPSPGARSVVSADGGRTEARTLSVARSWGPLAALRGAPGLGAPRRGQAHREAASCRV